MCNIARETKLVSEKLIMLVNNFLKCVKIWKLILVQILEYLRDLRHVFFYTIGYGMFCASYVIYNLTILAPIIRKIKKFHTNFIRNFFTVAFGASQKMSASQKNK